MSDDICTNCGHWKGLHHFETNQCPAGGEAPVGRKQNWLMSIYQAPDKRDATIAAQAATIAQLQSIATAARPLVGTMQNLIDDNHLESPEVLNDAWVQVLGSDLVQLAAALAALEQETK